MTRLERALASIFKDLIQLKTRCALVGGLAVSIRAVPRTTRDIDLAVAVEDDHEAEDLVRALHQRGYKILGQVHQEAVERLATVQLAGPGADEEALRIDLLFATSGIEPEIARGAEMLRAFPGFHIPVARIPHLIALKTLSESPQRGQDRADLFSLLRVATVSEIDEAGELLDLISARGFARGKNLRGELENSLGLLRQSQDGS